MKFNVRRVATDALNYKASCRAQDADSALALTAGVSGRATGRPRPNTAGRRRDGVCPVATANPVSI